MTALAILRSVLPAPKPKDLAAKLHKCLLTTSWADTSALVVDKPFWLDVKAYLGAEAEKSPQFKKTPEWVRLQRIFSALDACEELRDYINQMLETLEREAHQVTSVTPNVKMSDTIKNVVESWQQLSSEHHDYPEKVEESVGKGVKLLRQRYRFTWPDEHRAFY